jgi:hypothetical protein
MIAASILLLLFVLVVDLWKAVPVLTYFQNEARHACLLRFHFSEDRDATRPRSQILKAMKRDEPVLLKDRKQRTTSTYMPSALVLEVLMYRPYDTGNRNG